MIIYDQYQPSNLLINDAGRIFQSTVPTKSRIFVTGNGAPSKAMKESSSDFQSQVRSSKEQTRRFSV